MTTTDGIPASLYATCEDCGRTMEPGGGCTMTHVSKGQHARLVKRIFYGEEADDWGAGEGRACHDCNAGPGQPHHAGCDVERCPRCGGQMMGCLGDITGLAEELAAHAGEPHADSIAAILGESCGWTHLAAVP